MSTTAIYQQIKADLDSGELKTREAAILSALLYHNEGVTREQLVRITDGRVAYLDINADPADRKNRRAIAALRDRLIPVKSSSGEAGYRLDATVEGLREMLAEMEARRDKAAEKAQRVREMISRCEEAPIASPIRVTVAMPQPTSAPVQMSML